MVFAAVERGVNVTVGSVIAVTSCCVSCGSKILKRVRVEVGAMQFPKCLQQVRGLEGP